MKKILNALETLIFIYAILVGIEFFYGFRECDRLLIRINISNNKEMIHEKGLGYDLYKYNLTSEQKRDGAVLEEFKLFGITLGKTEVIS